MNTKIINLFGAPGSGKSTTAAGLFYEMKKKHYKVELAYEWIKYKLYEENSYPFNDQIYTFAKQHKQINQLLGKVDYIITDSPLLLSIIYDKEQNEALKNLVLKQYNSYDNYNFILERTHDYEQYGRNETEEESKEIQIKLYNIFTEYNIKYSKVRSDNAIKDIMFIMNLWEA